MRIPSSFTSVHTPDKSSSSKITRVPTLITFGENETMPISTAKIMQKEIPNSRLVTTPDGGHHHMVDNPDVYYKHLADFIREVEDGRFKGE